MMKERVLKGARSEREAIVKASTSTAQRKNVHRDHLQSKVGVFERLNRTIQEMESDSDIRRAVQWELDSRFFVQAVIEPKHLQQIGFEGRLSSKLISALKAKKIIDSTTNRISVDLFSLEFRKAILELDPFKELSDKTEKEELFEKVKKTFFEANIAEPLRPTRLLERYYFETMRNLWFLIGGDNSAKCAEDAIVYLVCDPLIGTDFFADCALELGNSTFIDTVRSLIEQENCASQQEKMNTWLQEHPNYESFDFLDVTVHYLVENSESFRENLLHLIEDTVIDNNFVLQHIGDKTLLERVDLWIDQKWSGARALQAKIALYSRRYDYLITQLEMAFKGGEMDKETYDEKLKAVNLDLSSLKDMYKKQVVQTNMQERVSEASSASGDLDFSSLFPGISKEATVRPYLLSMQSNPITGLKDLLTDLSQNPDNLREAILAMIEELPTDS